MTNTNNHLKQDNSKVNKGHAPVTFGVSLSRIIDNITSNIASLSLLKYVLSIANNTKNNSTPMLIEAAKKEDN